MLIKDDDCLANIFAWTAKKFGKSLKTGSQN